MSHDKITVRYGSSLILDGSVEDVTAETIIFYLGSAGEPPVLTKTFAVTTGVFQIVLTDEDTRLPLGTYSYQINVTYPDRTPEKYPSRKGKLSDFPTIEILEVLDETEVS